MTSRERPTRLPDWVTVPVSRVYGWEVARRNKRYDRGMGVERLDRPVISVGNLSAGGTGKTPMVRWVVRELQRLGHHPAIAMRGYKARPGEVSDEEGEHRAELAGVPVVARPDRANGLRALFASPEGRGVDCVVLDDGFQHRRLARDLDVVLIDATRPSGGDALIPAGFLREPVASLSRADAVVVTRCELVTPEEARAIVGEVRRYVRDKAVPVIPCETVWREIRVVSPDAGTLAPDALRGRRVVACCAIGNPRAFVRGIERAGATVCAEFVRADHAPYAPSEVAALDALARRHDAQAVVTTAKDWGKLARVLPGVTGAPVWVPVVDLAMDAGPLTTLLAARTGSA